MLGVGIGMGLYDPAFATVTWLYGRDARSATTGIALIAGFASTIGWPLTTVFEFDGHVVRGHDALREYAVAHTRVLKGRHMTLNHLYDVQGDSATGLATTVVSIATPSGYKIMGQGVYQDDLVKIDGKWKIRHRRVTNDQLVADPTKPVNLADPDVAVLVQQLIDTANDLVRRR